MTVVNKLIDRKSFDEEQLVMAELGGLKFRGYIRGVGMQGIIDLWIVEVHPDDRHLLPKKYPYSCILAPHPLVEPINE